MTEMTSRLKELLKTAEGDWFKGKLTRHDHFEALARINDALNRVSEKFVVEDRCRFMTSCFGHFMSMHQELKFSGGVIHQLLLRELDHDEPTNEMRFLLGNHAVRFSKVEFSLITGLRFGVLPDTSIYVAVENGIHQRHSIFSFKHALPQRREERRQQSQGDVGHSVEGYNIYGLSHALLIFAFEMIPQLGIVFGTRRVTDFFPRLLKWELTKQSRAKKLEKIFSARDERVHLLTVPEPTTSAVRPEEEGEGGRCTETEALDPTGPDFRGMDTGESESSPQRVRRRKVWLTTPGIGSATGDSRAGVRLDREVS
ncbi:hypothetical protein Ddye_012540 [Dipteronia dyeriana]|uniref:Uncharacterized protein n=1 Tax=Dipteronia dyeriana TaxID=168575 RepID=A0AAD9X4J0_9ROSI|nr:hypothetical protein Ddye_012540 [Dipteronia dyeriana]